MGCPQNLVCGETVDCGSPPAENEPADCYLQCLIHNTPPGGTLILPPRRWLLEGLPDPLNSNPANAKEFRIPIRKPITIDFNGAEVFFQRYSDNSQDDWRKGFLVVPDINDCYGFYDQEFPFVAFRNGRFIGNAAVPANIPFNNYYGVIGTSSENPLALKIGRMEVDSCVFQNLSAGVVFNSFSSGYIRQSVLSNCVFDNIVVDPAKQNDSERGRAATFSLPYQKPTQCSGLSLGNVFRGCQRHSIYVFSGGPFLSEGDKFIDGSLANVGSYPVAAVSLKGGSGFDEDDPDVVGKQGGDHMRVANGYFENCKVGIALTRARPNHPENQNPVPVIPFDDVSISDCRFVSTNSAASDLYKDIVLNNGDPATNGLWRNVVVEQTFHEHRNRDQTAIVVNLFQNLILRDVTFHLRQTETAQDDYGAIFVFANGTDCDNLLIERVIATYDPAPPNFARMIVLADAVRDEDHGSPSVIIRDIATPYVPVYPVPTSSTPPVYGSGTNGNIRIKVDPYFS